MRIAFVLPAPARVPMGGVSVVMRHAEGLADRGHDVSVLAPRRAPGLWPRVREWAIVTRDLLHGVAGRRFGASGVETAEPATLEAADLSGYSAVIATGHQTAPWVHDSQHPNAFYFIQGDERALSRRAEATWGLPLRRFTVSRGLAARLESRGLSVEGVVPNAIDPAEMYATTASAQRPSRVIALYHRHPVKGPDVLVEALHRLRDIRDAYESVVVHCRTRGEALQVATEVVQCEAGLGSLTSEEFKE